MKKSIQSVAVFTFLALFVIGLSAQETNIVRFNDTDEVLVNPGIGFTTFQRFNGDELNDTSGIGWTEGQPIKYQEFDGSLENKNYPMTSIAYFRVYWRFIEPEKGNYNWAMIDKALITAHQRKQTLLLRFPPYGAEENSDVPDWYREMVGDEYKWAARSPIKKWVVDPENPLYAKYYGKFISALGEHYDGHPDIEGVDLAIVGAWGEGAGSDLLQRKTMEHLINAYTDNFKKTPLIILLTDVKTNKYASSQANLGWRVDCLGDLSFWAREDNNYWTHMCNHYPQNIIKFGMKDAWKTAPVSLEICGTFNRWKDLEAYDAEDVKHIFKESLKWHISSFNAKSAPVPKEWEPLVNDWLKKMGYRFVLRSFTYPKTVAPNDKLSFETWWENTGVAPCYKKFVLAIRLINNQRTEVFLTDADINSWLPGDNIFDDGFYIPANMPQGNYEIQVGIVDRQSHQPKVKLAIDCEDSEGWYTLGSIDIGE